MSTKPKSTPKTYVVANPNGNGKHPRRDPAANEAILERATAKLEALSDHFDRQVREAPTKEDLHQVYLEARHARRLLDEHLTHDREDRKAVHLRLDAIMGLLGEVLSRLTPPPAADTPPPSTKPSPSRQSFSEG